MTTADRYDIDAQLNVNESRFGDWVRYVEHLGIVKEFEEKISELEKRIEELKEMLQGDN